METKYSIILENIQSINNIEDAELMIQKISRELSFRAYNDTTDPDFDNIAISDIKRLRDAAQNKLSELQHKQRLEQVASTEQQYWQALANLANHELGNEDLQPDTLTILANKRVKQSIKGVTNRKHRMAIL